MKRLIPIFLCLLLLVGCSQRMFTPVINTDFEIEAVYRAGDFSYNCLITKNKNVITIEPLSTRAKGMQIIYDGKEVTFKKGKFSKSFDTSKIDSTNPAKIIYGVFDYLENADDLEVKRIDNQFQYTGKTAVGNFVLTQNDDNSFESLVIKNANISIEFNKKQESQEKSK